MTTPDWAELTRFAIDRGIEKNGSLLFWTSLILAAAVALAALPAGVRAQSAPLGTRVPVVVLVPLLRVGRDRCSAAWEADPYVARKNPRSLVLF